MRVCIETSFSVMSMNYLISKEKLVKEILHLKEINF